MPRASRQLANMPAVATMSELHYTTASDESYAVCFISLMYMSPLIKVALGLFGTQYSRDGTDAHTLLRPLGQRVWVGEWQE